MQLKKLLEVRCNNSCEICSTATEEINSYLVPPKTEVNIENAVALCNECFQQISTSNYSNSNYWRCVTGSIWSETPAVQTLSYKILQALKNEAWATETLDATYVDESIVEWANAEADLAAAQIIHKDSYGNLLETGDTVILTQNLNVKGANFKIGRAHV